jgi:hypothetical protein
MVRSWLVAWIFCAALWLVFTDSVRVTELLAGTFVAALGASGFELVRRQGVAGQTLRPWFRAREWRTVLRIPMDVWRLTRAAFAQLRTHEATRGRMVVQDFGHTGDDPDERATRGAAIGLGTISPNSIIAGVDPETRLLLLHQLEHE